MAYTPTRVVTVSGIQLSESTNLSAAVSTFVGKKAFLVVTKDRTNYVLDLSRIILLESGLNLTAPLSGALTSRLTDMFVIKYQRDDIPLLNEFGTYPKHVKVFNPNALDDYTVGFSSVDAPQYVDDISRRGYLDDLVISSEWDLTNCLVAVNGVFHRTLMFQDKLYVLDGFRTLRISEGEDITVVDTGPIGGHTVIPLTPSNVTHTTFNGVATIKPGVSLRNKTVFLVVDGYLYHLDANAYYFGNDSTLKVYTNKMPLISQFRHNPRTMTRPDLYGTDAPQSSRKYVDSYCTKFLNNRVVPRTELANADFQRSRLTHYHSFLVVVDNPSVFAKSTTLLASGTPQMYLDMSGKVLTGIMAYSAGLCPSYLIKEDVFKRKTIYIQKQDYDPDIYKQTLNPTVIPALMSDIDTGQSAFCRLVDYFSV